MEEKWEDIQKFGEFKKTDHARYYLGQLEDILYELGEVAEKAKDSAFNTCITLKSEVFDELEEYLCTEAEELKKPDGTSMKMWFIKYGPVTIWREF